MRDIDLSAKTGNEMPVYTFVVYGATRSGKTAFSGTFPRPLILADVTEKGYETLRPENWSDEHTPRFESDVEPIVWGMENESDFAQAIERAKPLIASGRVKTICISSISFYADLILNSILLRLQKNDMRKAYGELGIHLRNTRIKAHSLGINVVWEALALDPEEDRPLGGPMIPGQQGAKFSAGVDFIFHAREDKPQPTKPSTFQLRTKRFGPYIAGNRLGGRAALLPDPMPNNYTALIEALGHDPDAIRASFVPMSRIPKTIPAIPAAVAAPATPPAAKAVADARPVTRIVTPTNGKPAISGR